MLLLFFPRVLSKWKGGYGRDSGVLLPQSCPPKPWVCEAFSNSKDNCCCLGWFINRLAQFAFRQLDIGSRKQMLRWSFGPSSLLGFMSGIPSLGRRGGGGDETPSQVLAAGGGGVTKHQHLQQLSTLGRSFLPNYPCAQW